MCEVYETIFRESLKDFRIAEGGQISGFCTSSAQVEKLLHRLKSVGFSYSVSSRFRNQPSTGGIKSKTNYFFQQLQGYVCVPFFGPAFSVESVCHRHCSLKTKYYKERGTAVPEHLEDHVTSRKMDGRKSDCPAVIHIKCVKVFPEYLIQSANEHWGTKAKVIGRLRKDLELSQKPDSYLRFYVLASSPSLHTHATERVEASETAHHLLVETDTDTEHLVAESSDIEDKRQEIRDICQRIIDFTYVCKDDAIMNKILKTLKEVVQILESENPEAER